MNSIRTRRDSARLGGRSDGVQYYDNVIQSNTKVLNVSSTAKSMPTLF